MNVWDILILVEIAAMVLLAVRAIQNGKTGGCHSGSCSGDCAACMRHCERDKRGERP